MALSPAAKAKLATNQKKFVKDKASKAGTKTAGPKGRSK